MISYYDVIGMIKNGNIPKRIRLFIFDKSAVYYFDQENSSYLIEDPSAKNDNFKEYLNECLTDMDYLENKLAIEPEDSQRKNDN